MECVESKYVCTLKSGETSSIYPSHPLATLFDLDIYLRTIEMCCLGNPSQLAIMVSTSFLFSKSSTISMKLC